MTNFIKLQYAEFLEDYTDGALFLGAIGMDQIFSHNNLVEIDGLLAGAGRDTLAESILPFFKGVGYTLTDIAELYNAYVIGDDPDDFEDAEEFADHIEINLMEAVDCDTSAFINDMLYYIGRAEVELLTEKFLDYLELETYTVGYSPWSRVVTYKGSNQEFYEDLYNGWNFYDLVQVDQHGELIDIIGGFYIRNEKELYDAVTENFGLDEFKLINNEEAGAFDLPKAETITTYK